MANRFKNPLLRKQYDACVTCYRNKHRDIVRPDGNPHRGNAIAVYFWRGYERVKVNWDANSRAAPIYAAYRAGSAMRVADDENAEMRRAIHLPPLPTPLL